jgi:hypothetical protein
MDDQPNLSASEDGSSAPDGSGAHLCGLRAAVERGIEDIKAGRVVDLDEAFTRIEAMLDELEAAKRG